MTTIIVILGLMALLWFGLWISPIHRVMWRQILMSNTPLPDLQNWPALTLIVPARNEAAMLPGTIPSMCNQDYPNLRVIVVDDQSDDGSDEVLRALQLQHANLTVVRAEQRPEGWCGKPWAVMQGVKQTDTELLLFTDADIIFHPLAAKQAVRLLQSGNLDLVSLFPKLDFGFFMEKIGLCGLVTVLGMAFPSGLVNNPKSKVAMAAGGFILLRKTIYDAVGGHECVKSQVIEDVNLAKKLKESGARIHCRLTRDLISTRMYEDFGDLWEGLGKNAYAGMEYQPRKFWVGLIIGIVLVVLPPLYLVVSLVAALLNYPATPQIWAIVGLAALINLFMISIHSRTTRHLGLPAWHGALMFFSIGFYNLIAINSFYHFHFKGGNMWKGRRYSTQNVADAPPPPVAQ